jgi:hypothetical protein
MREPLTRTQLTPTYASPPHFPHLTSTLQIFTGDTRDFGAVQHRAADGHHSRLGPYLRQAKVTAVAAVTAAGANTSSTNSSSSTSIEIKQTPFVKRKLEPIRL